MTKGSIEEGKLQRKKLDFLRRRTATWKVFPGDFKRSSNTFTNKVGGRDKRQRIPSVKRDLTATPCPRAQKLAYWGDDGRIKIHGREGRV